MYLKSLKRLFIILLKSIKNTINLVDIYWQNVYKHQKVDVIQLKLLFCTKYQYHLIRISITTSLLNLNSDAKMKNSNVKMLIFCRNLLLFY